MPRHARLLSARLFRSSLLAAAAMLLSLRTAHAQTVQIPDTPAGQTLRAWLQVLGSGDRAQAEQYVHTIDKDESADGLIGFHNQTGGFDLVSIETSEPLHLRFIVKEKDSPLTALGNLSVKPGQPPTVATFGLRALPPGAKLVNVTLDPALRERVISGIQADLTDSYIDPEVAARMNAALTAHQKAGDYNSIADPDAFVAQLTKDMRAVSHDMHLHVEFSPFQEPTDSQPSPEDVARVHKQILHNNCEFKRAEILPNNVGYLKFDAFGEAELCAPVASAAMAFLAHTSALIIDLRENGGGDPAMVSYLASYLFDKPTHLNDLYYRKDNSTHQYWTLPSVPGELLATEPVFVLTSKNTFSGAEEFSYDMQTQKRATLVGETTGGGAHPIHGETVAEYFTLLVPGGKPINPVTHTDWEGTGVVPEVKVPAADALATAEKLAAEQIQKSAH